MQKATQTFLQGKECKNFALFIYNNHLTPTSTRLLPDPTLPSCSPSDPSLVSHSLILQPPLALKLCVLTPVPHPRSQPAGHFLISCSPHAPFNEFAQAVSFVITFLLDPIIPIFYPFDFHAKPLPPSPRLSAGPSPAPAVCLSAAPRLDSLSQSVPVFILNSPVQCYSILTPVLANLPSSF